jgi:hypothetical protein
MDQPSITTKKEILFIEKINFVLDLLIKNE